ncbi:hypothetical protein L1077_07895 [Pseudoalteromonas luteoviolacea]|uniref:hypothetical protein n=1 Tax=Pseudoalteromonas luteoviolacea TaxID=43657 RepID=UPI001F2604B4|nr:hypothetical protein [Pseudoalteromonas luteoviolacea]MCF6439348.1 hypothetical protein [Pseudoalteromonas luteoviolacea]
MNNEIKAALLGAIVGGVFATAGSLLTTFITLESHIESLTLEHKLNQDRMMQKDLQDAYVRFVTRYGHAENAELDFRRGNAQFWGEYKGIQLQFNLNGHENVVNAMDALIQNLNGIDEPSLMHTSGQLNFRSKYNEKLPPVIDSMQTALSKDKAKI